MLNVGPRFGTAWDVSGKQTFVVRGSLGLYFDRPRGGNAQALVGNTFVSTLQTLRYSQLQSLGGLRTAVTRAAHRLSVQQQAADLHGVEHRDADDGSMVDVGGRGVRRVITTTTPSSPSRSTPSTSARRSIPPSRIRRARQARRRAPRRWPRCFQISCAATRATPRSPCAPTTAGARIDAIQFSINRRLRNGISFGFNDAITLRDIAKVAPRYDHDAAGNLIVRADQAQAAGASSRISSSRAT